MTISRHSLLAVVAVMAIGPLVARDAANVAHAINTDSTSTISIIQPTALDAVIGRVQSVTEPVVETEPMESFDNDPVGQTRVAGYRVQVFSDNNQRTAKGEARSKERLLRGAFPELGTYVVYNSPFWRLKVGDFRTQHEAEAIADEIKSRFPSFAREVRVVRDRVNVRR
ncbi:MAG: SPOR domain-containing protein [Muribaculaceae bacterium]|nr:SPOR domain-containing protein [Muribaculaceae bacterium]